MASNASILGRFAGINSAAIAVHQERCAKVRNRNVACLKCADVCTSGCISLEEGELRIDASLCVGCGTCAAVCPTCALEARDPDDIRLVSNCLAHAHKGEVLIVCEQLRRALDGLLREDAAVCVTCIGRVDESLLCALAAHGIKRVSLGCGICERCEQEVGLAAAQAAVASAKNLLAAWGSRLCVNIDTCVPERALLGGEEADAGADVAGAAVSAADADRAIEEYFVVMRGNEPVRPRGEEVVVGVAAEDGAASTANKKPDSTALLHVMKDGTMPHFIPDKRERLLESLATIGEPVERKLHSRLWGWVIIDGAKCSSCRMCATFCPTGAITKFDDADGTFGVYHYPADCVKCGSCQDICDTDAIRLLDEVDTRFLAEGHAHRYVMRDPEIELGTAQQILNTMRVRMKGSDIFER